MAFHNAQPVGENHKIHNWTVADAAARTALVVVAGDVGKVCLQSDTSDFYVLANNVGPVWKIIT